MDTPAVHYAKMDHFARYNYEAARNTYGAYGLYGYNGLYHPMAGVYQPDTLEVTLAKMDHFRAKDEALARLG